MSKNKQRTVAVNPEGFGSEYTRISKEFGGVQKLMEKINRNYSKQYLSTAKRNGKCEPGIFQGLVSFGANPDIMMNGKAEPAEATVEESDFDVMKQLLDVQTRQTCLILHFKDIFNNALEKVFSDDYFKNEVYTYMVEEYIKYILNFNKELEDEQPL